MSGRKMLIRQSTHKLLKVLPPALGMLTVSAALLGLSIRSANLLGLFGGGLGVAFFGPAFLMLAHAIFQPSHLRIDEGGVSFRFYSLSLALPWHQIREVTAGVGWPSLTFDDSDAVARTATFHGFPPLGWLLQIPAKAVGLLLRQPLANLYPMSRRQLLQAFRANERMFGFHYGMPAGLLELGTEEILAALRRYKRKADSG